MRARPERTGGRRPTTGRSGFRVDDGSALFAYGDTTVRIDLADGATVRVGGTTHHDVRSIDVTVDEPGRFVRALAASAPSIAAGPENAGPD